MDFWAIKRGKLCVVGCQTSEIRRQMGCRMTLKVHMLDAHLDEFKGNMVAYSQEQGERFNQDILDFERRYQGQYNEHMIGDYIGG